MGNTNLTISMITKECLRVAHEKAVFIGNISRNYDEQYAKAGGKFMLPVPEPRVDEAWKGIS